MAVSAVPEQNRIWSAFSPWTTWEKIVDDFLEAGKNPVKLKTWIDTTLGEAWEEAGEKVEAHQLFMRREYYPTAVPGPAVVLLQEWTLRITGWRQMSGASVVRMEQGPG